MKRAIIVGASSGMGYEISKILLNDGWTLGVAARRTDRLDELTKNFPGKVITKQIDVMKDDAPELLKEFIDELQGIDLYFHVAGIGKQNPSLDAQIEKSTVITNGLGFTQMIGAAYRYMAKHGGGHIAVISSIAGTRGLGAAPSYSATKAFQNTYIEALEQLSMMRKLNIRFTDIRPGFVNTDLLNDSHRYPMLLNKEKAARLIVNAVYAKKHVKVIDWKYQILTFFWKLIPHSLWRRLPIRN